MNTATRTETSPSHIAANKGITTPEGDHRQLIENVVNAVNTAATNVSTYTVGHATPPSVQPVPSSEVRQIQAGINAEPVFDTKDLSDMMKKTLGHAVNDFTGNAGLSVHGEVSPGHKGLSMLKQKFSKRIRGLLHRK